MDTKIGKLIYTVSLLFCGFFYAQDKVELEIRNHENRLSKELQIGVPFSVDLVIHSDKKETAGLEIDGLDQFVLQGGTQVSSSTRVFNGVRSSTKTYRYGLKKNEAGTYTVGPATVYLDGVAVTADPVTIILSNTEPQKNAETDTFLLMNVNKKEFFVGEKIDFTLSFYNQGSTKLEGLEKPDFSAFNGGDLIGPFKGESTFDGKEYEGVQWRGFLYGKKPGVVNIPPASAVFSLDVGRSSGFGLFGNFFQDMYQKQIYSNAVRVTIKPLPPYKGAVHGVGRFTNITATIDHNDAAQGEGIVYKLTVVGDADFDGLKQPELQVPEGITYYDSKTYVQNRQVDGAEKIFEYIIQANKTGDITIPEQQFTFFDVAEKKYKTLKTESIQLAIKPAVAYGAVAKKEEKKEEEVEKTDDDIGPPIEDGKWRGRAGRSLSWALFFVVASLICGVAIFTKLYRWMRAELKKNEPAQKKKYAFSVAKKELLQLKKAGDDQKLYDLFVSLWADRLMKEKQVITQEFIRSWLLEKNVENGVLSEWKLFYETISRRRFFYSVVSADEREKLFNESEKWIETLKDIL